jgi:hypothetical protein
MLASLNSVHPSPAVVVGDVTLEATLADGHIRYTLHAPAGQPIQPVWLGDNGAELLLAGYQCDLSDLLEARNRIRADLAVMLRQQGLSVRKTATLLGVYPRQVERWERGVN